MNAAAKFSGLEAVEREKDRETALRCIADWLGIAPADVKDDLPLNDHARFIISAIKFKTGQDIAVLDLGGITAGDILKEFSPPDSVANAPLSTDQEAAIHCIAMYLGVNEKQVVGNFPLADKGRTVATIVFLRTGNKNMPTAPTTVGEILASFNTAPEILATGPHG